MADMSLSDKLCNASASGNKNEVLLLLEKGAHVNGFNTFKRTALQVVKLGDTGVVEALLEAGADPNVPDPSCGLTVTHDAAREGFLETVRTLVEYGADVNLLDNRNNLPLHWAAGGGHLEVVELIIGLTANPRAANSLGRTAAQLAQLSQHERVAEYIGQYLASN
ncbi:cyclin-dependent kinase 4 inhibitor C isoform X2 [Mugil cephalus]|uniref:cyclin-dependent kinase 4 inhibitor C isoform X2 n=1 Tax=Mugil cephalus TaxID=48193 RepID=UPI001FB6F426|nr:cyclin-dependent kinase 4 inhibitor C isoform X2 [Mugil cephalus]